MSASGPEPAWWPPAQSDQGTDRRRVKPAHLLLGSLLALVLLCCGGAAAVRTFTGGGDHEPGAVAGQPSAPSAGATTAVRAPAATSPAPSTKPPRKTSTPKPKPTTRKPTSAPTTRPPTKTPAPTPTTTAPPGPIVRAGAFCSPVGALGHTATGRLMRCTLKPGEERPRWRAV